LLVRVECNAELGALGEGAKAHFRDQVAHDVRTMLGLRTMVEVVDPGTYPRTDFKARRVIDDRQVFKDMQQRLQTGAA
jgi:phenylacetate-CoA ligase